MDQVKTPGSDNRRREDRLQVQSVTMPFLGSREADRQPFQYILMDSSPGGAQVAIPNWVLTREKLNIGDRVNLNMPFRLENQSYDQGVTAWAKWDPDSGAQYCGLRLDRPSPLVYPIFIDMTKNKIELDLQEFETEEGLLVRMIKEAYLLKKGVLIYLKHLTPYLSRVGELSREDLSVLREMLLDDIVQRVTEHKNGLEALFHQASEKIIHERNLAALLDLEQFHALIESEIYQGLLEITFDSQLANLQVNSIKILEERLYFNFNLVVMLFLRSLELT
ncbi:MAG: hypothetical protein V1816_12225 [Pseudomonadota bacterium]